MFFREDSLSIVLIGDWNKLFIQPDWMAENVYEKQEIEIGVSGRGTDFEVSYRCDNVIVSPRQDRVVFTAVKEDEETLDILCRCLNNFIGGAYTPSGIVYGLNCDFKEEDGSKFADMADRIEDSGAIIESGYEIVSTKICRTLENNGKIINMDSYLKDDGLSVHFNEHHEEGGTPVFTVGCIKEFKTECCTIVSGLGYELEENK